MAKMKTVWGWKGEDKNEIVIGVIKCYDTSLLSTLGDSDEDEFSTEMTSSLLHQLYR